MKHLLTSLESSTLYTQYRYTNLKFQNMCLSFCLISKLYAHSIGGIRLLVWNIKQKQRSKFDLYKQIIIWKGRLNYEKLWK